MGTNNNLLTVFKVTSLDVTRDPDMKPWPQGWPEYHNANVDPCDMAVGPCACGAWHGPGEFYEKNKQLFRNGRLVADNREVLQP